MKYKDLTPNQKRIICNGCGGKGSKVPVPEFLFHASCNHHDFEYWRGCTKEDRRKADVNFYREMLRDAKGASWIKQPYYKLWAWIYFRAVRMFGGKFFHYSMAQRDEKSARGEEWKDSIK